MINNIGGIRFNNSSFSFKHKVVFDIGASQPDGSLKVRVFSEKGDLIYYTSDSKNRAFQLNNREKYNNEDEFIEKIADVFTKTEEKAINEIENNKGKYNQEEKNITGFLLLVPSLVKNNNIVQLTNIMKKDNNPLKNIATEKIKRQIERKISENPTSKIKLSEDFQFKTLQDTVGSSLYVTRQLMKSQKIKEGSYIVPVITGGGTGNTNVKVLGDDDILVEICGTNYGGISKEQKIQSLTELGASAKKLLGNYFEEAGFIKSNNINNDNLYDARIVTLSNGERIEINEETYTALINYIPKGANFKPFSLHKENDRCYVELNSEDQQALESHFKASKHAVNKYIEAITQLAFIKINEGANLFVLTGPLALGIDEFINKNSNLFKQDYKVEQYTLRDLLLYKIKQCSNGSIKNWIEVNNFDVICNKQISVEDNAQSAFSLFSNNTKILGQNSIYGRNNWIMVKRQDIEKIQT